MNLNAIQSQQERAILKAFYQSVNAVKEQAVISEIARLISAGNIEQIVELLRLDPVSFRPLESSILSAYELGGITGAAQIGNIPTASGRVVARFDIRSPAAERFISDLSSRKIVEISNETRETVRRVIREGMEIGQGPRSTALDLVGRIDKSSGNRIGGYIGLTDQQASWVQKARIELETLNENYLTRKLRDKRLDSAFLKSLETGKPMTALQIDAAVSRMQARALRYRADNIARTESLQALSEGQSEAINQAINQGEVSEVLKYWDATGDSRTRPEHADAETLSKDGIPFDQPFLVDGEPIQRPRQLGASAKNVINCRCRMITKIDFSGQAAKQIRGF